MLPVRFLLICLATLFLVGCKPKPPLETRDIQNTTGAATITGEVWVDNWFALYIGDQLIIEDSVPITTERSFNAERFTFKADFPLTLCFVIKDFKQNDTGLEYIGSNRQQMGDGGMIAQFTDADTGELLAVTSADVKCLVIHEAPLDTDCEKEQNPTAGESPCGFKKTPEPEGWKAADFDDSEWQNATVYSESDVRPKGGFDLIHWAPSAKLIWSSNLKTHNTILCRMKINGPTATKVDEDSQKDSTAFVATQKKSNSKRPAMAEPFTKFKDKVKVHWDTEYLYVESDGLPSHPMMTGIRAWQQQVPLPQPFTGKNAWQIPRQPRLATQPISAKTNLFRGAIALAVNGVPIFNALNNRGEDAYLAGELDRWGGHCGRGDDYHYHMAPVHLEKIVGKGMPIAYALDGYPIYGFKEPDGSAVRNLDQYNGHTGTNGNYHYHSTKKYPYINGGMRGVVTVRDGQIEPQPRDSPVRAPLRPLRGATITNFKTTGNKSELFYRLGGKTGSVTYSTNDNKTFTFRYQDPNGRVRTETYQRRERGRRPVRPNRRPPRKP